MSLNNLHPRYELISLRLSSAGYSVHTAESGENALSTLAVARPDVVVTDLKMPGMPGMEVLRLVKQRSPDTEVIVMTGYGTVESAVDAMKAGASDYLVKGKVDPDLLERSIRYALERVRAEEALRDSEERHRGMFDHLPIGLYRSTLDGEFTLRVCILSFRSHRDRVEECVEIIKRCATEISNR